MSSKSAFFIFFISILGRYSSAQDLRDDSSVFYIGHATINKKNYTGFVKNDFFYLINSKGSQVIKQKGVFFNWEFKDFNEDSFKDVILTYSSNTPLVQEFFIFLPASNNFRKVQ